MDGAPVKQPQAPEAKAKEGAGSPQTTSRQLALRLENVYSRGLLVGLVQFLVPAVIPAYDYLEAYGKEDRLLPYTVVFIAANAVVGVLGIAASTQRKSWLLSLHAAAAVVVGCVVGGLCLLLSHLMWLQCDLKAKSFDGCNELLCSCLIDDSCTTTDFTENDGCKACRAYPNDVCAYFDKDGVMGSGFSPETYKAVVIVLANVVSAACSLLALVRKEHFESIQRSRAEIVADFRMARQGAMMMREGPQAPQQQQQQQQQQQWQGKAGQVAAALPPPGPLQQQRSLGNSDAPPAVVKPAKSARRKKSKSKKVSPVTAIGGEQGLPKKGLFDLGASGRRAGGPNAMMDQTEYDRLRQSVQRDGGAGMQEDGQPPGRTRTRNDKQEGHPQVEQDLGLEDVDDFLGSLM